MAGFDHLLKLQDLEVQQILVMVNSDLLMRSACAGSACTYLSRIGCGQNPLFGADLDIDVFWI